MGNYIGEELVLRLRLPAELNPNKLDVRVVSKVKGISLDGARRKLGLGYRSWDRVLAKTKSLWPHEREIIARHLKVRTPELLDLKMKTYTHEVQANHLRRSVKRCRDGGGLLDPSPSVPGAVAMRYRDDLRRGEGEGGK